MPTLTWKGLKTLKRVRPPSQLNASKLVLEINRCSDRKKENRSFFSLFNPFIPWKDPFQKGSL